MPTAQWPLAWGGCWYPQGSWDLRSIPSLMGEGTSAPTAAPAPQLLGGRSPGGSQPSIHWTTQCPCGRQEAHPPWLLPQCPLSLPWHLSPVPFLVLKQAEGAHEQFCYISQWPPGEWNTSSGSCLRSPEWIHQRPLPWLRTGQVSSLGW